MKFKIILFTFLYSVFNSSSLSYQKNHDYSEVDNVENNLNFFETKDQTLIFDAKVGHKVFLNKDLEDQETEMNFSNFISMLKI